MTGAGRTVLITGCSSGIGAALAQEFHARGHKVIATARKLDSIAAHKAAGMATLALDVNDAASIAQAVASVQASHGHIDILVNSQPATGHQQAWCAKHAPALAQTPAAHAQA